jgi:hypothetical protein
VSGVPGKAAFHEVAFLLGIKRSTNMMLLKPHWSGYELAACRTLFFLGTLERGRQEHDVLTDERVSRKQADC